MAHLHPLRLDHLAAAAARLDPLHLGQADPRAEHLGPLRRERRLARAELPLALGLVERDAVLRALGLAWCAPGSGLWLGLGLAWCGPG